MNWVRHSGSTTFETKSSYCRVARQGLRFKRFKRALVYVMLKHKPIEPFGLK